MSLLQSYILHICLPFNTSIGLEVYLASIDFRVIMTNLQSIKLLSEHWLRAIKQIRAPFEPIIRDITSYHNGTHSELHTISLGNILKSNLQKCDTITVLSHYAHQERAQERVQERVQ